MNNEEGTTLPAPKQRKRNRCEVTKVNKNLPYSEPNRKHLPTVQNHRTLSLHLTYSHTLSYPFYDTGAMPLPSQSQSSICMKRKNGLCILSLDLNSTRRHWEEQTSNVSFVCSFPTQNDQPSSHPFPPV